MTKEEILNNTKSLYPTKALEAMEEYAKQEAIEFCKWQINNGVVRYKDSGSFEYYYEYDGNKFHTGEQLYELYLKDKNK